MPTVSIGQNPVGKPAPTTVSLARNPVGKPVLGNRPTLNVAQNPIGKQLPAPAGAGTPAVPAPASTPAVQTNAAAAAPVSPLDSTYFQNLASNNLKVGNQINGWTADIGNTQTALQSALAALAYQQPRDQLKTEQAANQRGALYSSVYDQDLGNLNNSYLTKQTGDTTAAGQKIAGYNTDISGAQQGQLLYNSGQYDDAVGRATKLAAANPATGQAPAVTTNPAPVSAPLAAAIAAAANRPTVSLANNPIGKPAPPSRPTVSIAKNPIGKPVPKGKK